MKLIPLPEQSVALTGFSHKVVLTYADVAALGAAASGTIAIFPSANTFAAGMCCQRVALNLKTTFDFSDAGITSCLVEVGDGGDTDRLCAQTELAVDGTEILFFAAPQTAYAYPVADTIDAKFTVANGGSPLLSETTSGELEIYLMLVDLNDLESLG